jgi:V8-like Glu-specific endopeptidase
MTIVRRLLAALAAACATFAIAATPSMAIVGDPTPLPASPIGRRGGLAKGFLCTGTLIAPNYVLTAGHCSSLTARRVASPASFRPPPSTCGSLEQVGQVSSSPCSA